METLSYVHHDYHSGQHPFASYNNAGYHHHRNNSHGHHNQHGYPPLSQNQGADLYTHAMFGASDPSPPVPLQQMTNHHHHHLHHSSNNSNNSHTGFSFSPLASPSTTTSASSSTTSTSTSTTLPALSYYPPVQVQGFDERMHHHQQQQQQQQPHQHMHLQYGQQAYHSAYRQNGSFNKGSSTSAGTTSGFLPNHHTIIGNPNVGGYERYPAHSMHSMHNNSSGNTHSASSLLLHSNAPIPTTNLKEHDPLDEKAIACWKMYQHAMFQRMHDDSSSGDESDANPETSETETSETETEPETRLD